MSIESLAQTQKSLDELQDRISKMNPDELDMPYLEQDILKSLDDDLKYEEAERQFLQEQLQKAKQFRENNRKEQEDIRKKISLTTASIINERLVNSNVQRDVLVQWWWWISLVIIVACTIVSIVSPFYIFTREQQTGAKWFFTVAAGILGSYVIVNHLVFSKTWTGWFNDNGNQLNFMDLMKYFCLTVIFILIVNIVVSLVLGHISAYYNPDIKATYSGLVASLLGISLAILLITVSTFNQHKKILFALAIFELVLSVLAVAFQVLLRFYLGAWACLTWLSLGIGMILHYKDKAEKVMIEGLQSGSAMNINGLKSNEFINHQSNPIQIQNLDKKYCSKDRCCFCCYSCCLVTTMLLITLFTCCSIAYYANFSQFPAYGQKFMIQGKWNQQYLLHGYCVGKEQPVRPTIILEHGGGSNSIAFRELGKALSDKNWKLCAYDRLGYGRSNVISRNLTVQEKANVTNQVINRLLQDHTNKKVIFGGWSAGVELSQIYANLYPNDVQGLIFMDGYPDYVTLEAIQDNKPEPIPSGTLGVLVIARIFEPLGLGFVVGANQIANVESSQYYRGYYQTGYFWESQYFDVANPQSNTNWLTAKAGSASKPYPESKINLNWPDIPVPLLILPANRTVSGGQYSKIYMKQCQKYIQKCGSANKQIKIMDGDHGFVLKSPQLIATEINGFFAPIF